MAVTFDSISYVSDPKNPQINNDTFITAPKYAITFKYYTNTVDDDLAITATNTYQAIGDPVIQTGRTDFNVLGMQGSGTFTGDEAVGVLTMNMPLPAFVLQSTSGNYWRNMMVKIEQTPVPFPPPATPTFQWIGKLASGGANPVLFGEVASSATNPIPAGTRIYAPKVFKTITANLFFSSAVIKSGIYVVTLSFLHTFSNQVIKTQDIIIKYTETDADIGGGVPKNFTQHQWAYVYKDLDYADCGRIILSHDIPTVFQKAGVRFKFIIHLRGFYNEGKTNIINDTIQFEFTPKTDLNLFTDDTMGKVVKLK
jgi:hypothetical protein